MRLSSLVFSFLTLFLCLISERPFFHLTPNFFIIFRSLSLSSSSLYFSVSASASVCLPFCLSLRLCLALTLSHSLSHSLSFSLCLCLSVSLFLCLSRSRCLSCLPLFLLFVSLLRPLLLSPFIKACYLPSYYFRLLTSKKP